ncbi:hypothetical protein [Haladaptatus sp. NG-WS-4]
MNQLTDAIENRYKGPLWWGGSKEDGSSIKIHVADEGDFLHIGYTVTYPSGEQREIQYEIPIEYTECNFGGERPWFHCPECDDRVGKLYKPPSRIYFHCRECHDLGYKSSRESGDKMKEAKRRFQKVQRKLGIEPTRPNSQEREVPPRLKGMRQDTYHELLREYRAAQEAYDEAFMDKLHGLAKSTGIDMPPPSEK